MVPLPDGRDAAPIVPAPMEERRAFYESLVGSAIRGTWQLGRLVDFGSMGAVFNARHKSDSKEKYAVKILDPDLSTADRRYVRRFVREARILAEIDHPNIVKVFEHGQYEPPGRDLTLNYYVMELIRGPDGPPLTLHRYAQTRSLRMEEVVYIVSQILAGLRHVHEKGVIHRDLKPWNVLIDAKGRCRIVDFGLAKIPDSDLTQVDELFGSRDYIAPELFYRGAREATPAADLYAVGRIFADLVERVDFRGQGAGVFASKAAALKYLNQLLERLVQEDPTLRFKSAAEVMTVLDEFQKSTRIRTTVHSAARLAKAARIQSEDRRRYLATAARWIFDYGLFVLGIVLLPFVMEQSIAVGTLLAASLVTSKLWSALSHPPDRHPIAVVVRALAARLNRVLKEGDFRVQYYAPSALSLREWFGDRTPRFRVRHMPRAGRHYRALVFPEGVGLVGLAAGARTAVLTHSLPRWGTPAYRDLFENQLHVPRSMWQLFDPTRRSHFCIPVFRILRWRGREDLRVVGVLVVDSRLPDAFLHGDPQRAVKEYAAVIQDLIEPGHGAEVRQIAAGGAAPLETLLVNGKDPAIPPMMRRGTFAAEPDTG